MTMPSYQHTTNSIDNKPCLTTIGNEKDPKESVPSSSLGFHRRCTSCFVAAVGRAWLLLLLWVSYSWRSSSFCRMCHMTSPPGASVLPSSTSWVCWSIPRIVLFQRRRKISVRSRLWVRRLLVRVLRVATRTPFKRVINTGRIQRPTTAGQNPITDTHLFFARVAQVGWGGIPLLPTRFIRI